MAGKWKKAGARITGVGQVERKLEGKLHDWDFLPIGQKIGKMESLLSAIKSPSGKFKFLSLAGPEELKEIESRLAERLKAERHSLDDMRGVFEHYGVDLGKVGLKPEDISYPHGTKWSLDKEHGILLFSSPSMARWFEKNVMARGRQFSRVGPGPLLTAAINRERAFGLGRMSTYGRFLRYLPRKDIKIDLIQPLVFYKTTGIVLGKEGTAQELPLSNPDLLLFYAQLREAKNLGARKVRVANLPKYTISKQIAKTKKGEKVTSVRGEIHYSKMPYRKIYQRIMQMSGKPEEVDATHSIFTAKKALGGKA